MQTFNVYDEVLGQRSKFKVSFSHEQYKKFSGGRYFNPIFKTVLGKSQDGVKGLFCLTI